MTELLPCPFCGGEAKIVCVNTDRYDDWYVYCPSEDDCPASVETLMYETKEEAVAAWNTRAERTCRNVGYYIDGTRLKCSECDYNGWTKWAKDGEDRVPNYCPNCGARVTKSDQNW